MLTYTQEVALVFLGNKKHYTAEQIAATILENRKARNDGSYIFNSTYNHAEDLFKPWLARNHIPPYRDGFLVVQNSSSRESPYVMIPIDEESLFANIKDWRRNSVYESISFLLNLIGGTSSNAVGMIDLVLRNCERDPASIKLLDEISTALKDIGYRVPSIIEKLEKDRA